jgi:hypothetical protein
MPPGLSGSRKPFPGTLIVLRRIGEPFTDEKFVMHADDQHLLVIGSVEDADPSALLGVFHAQGILHPGSNRPGAA